LSYRRKTPGPANGPIHSLDT